MVSLKGSVEVGHQIVIPRDRYNRSASSVYHIEDNWRSKIYAVHTGSYATYPCIESQDKI